MHKKDFVDGNYYKLEYANYIFYFKYKHINHTELIDYYYDFHIYNGHVSFDDRKTYYEYNTRNCNNFKEVDFSEVVKYLPKNHHDRINFRNKRIKMLLC